MMRSAGRPAAARFAIPGGVLLAFVILCAVGQVATIVPVQAPAASGAGAVGTGFTFNPDAYVRSIWASKVVPAATEQSVPLTTLLAALKTDPAAAAKIYGHVVAGEANYLVRFSGVVSKLDTSSPLGVLTMTVPDQGGTVMVQVAIGPVILGSALRDALPFISFGQFLNQIQYGNVADALNTAAETGVAAAVASPAIVGQTLQVYGAMSFDSANPSAVTVIPVVLQKKG